MKTAVPASILALAAGGLAGGAAAGAKSPAAPGAQAAARLSGTWDVTVTRIAPPPGAAPTFRSLMTFTADGGMLETSSTGTSLRGPAHGAWIRTGQRRFSTSMLLFRFDTAGAFAGTQEINRTMVLSPDRTHFRAVSVARQVDPNGTVTVSGLRATEVGKRLQVTPLADQP